MPNEVFNFIWLDSPRQEYEYKVGLQVNNVIRTYEPARAVILYPALLTPLVYSEGRGEWLELLMAADRTLTPEVVNTQLKLSYGLKASKVHNPTALFGGATGNIEVEAAIFERDGIIKTHLDFSGILHQSARDYLEQNGLIYYYRVRVRAKLLLDDGDRRLSSANMQSKASEFDSSANRERIEKHAGRRHAITQDAIIRSMITRRVGSHTSLPEKGLYSFVATKEGIDLSQVDILEPIQSYHPVFVFSGPSAFDYANLGHLSDIHVNSRLDLLSKSPARVIDYDETTELAFVDESPVIGQRITRTGQNFFQLLSQLGASNAHAILIGGDLVDHIKNAYSQEMLKAPAPTAGEIWNAVDLNQSDKNYNKSHPAYLDFIAFYSLLISFYRSARKPVFCISGNHDCYLEAFGISPRIGPIRANAGIPADLNLTLYEALLVFGRSFDVSFDLENLRRNFQPDFLDWFYTVFTPFSDWWVKFPKQSLVGLAWGEGEDMVSDRLNVWDTAAMLSESQGWTSHLPRAKKGVSDEQLALLTAATAEREQRKVVLVTHFTVLSYLEGIPLSDRSDRMEPHKGELRIIWPGDYGMGTFELNRADVLQMLFNKKIQCVVTGHSHRRALYQLGPAKRPLFGVLNPRETAAYSYDPNLYAGRISEPAIVVSDSGGPYPRYNFSGEFMGWGSDKPSGTLVEFDAASGAIKKLHVSKCNCPKPRIAVAMDYLDIDKGEVFKRHIAATDWFSIAKEGESPYVLRIMLKDHVTKVLRITIARILLLGKVKADEPWIRLSLTYQGRSADGSMSWVVPHEDTTSFKRWVMAADGNCFIAFKLSVDAQNPLSSQYSFDDYWIMQVSCSSEDDGTRSARSEFRIPPRNKHYIIERPSNLDASANWFKGALKRNFPEVPDYAWRKRCFPARYGTP